MPRQTSRTASTSSAPRTSSKPARTRATRLIVTSSGAAYGYHPDNPDWLDENDPLRGNDEFEYSKHKRIVEEMLAQWREERPELRQIVFRPGTIVGADVHSPVTDLFEKPVMLGIVGSDSPFVFIWDQDLVACLVDAVFSDKVGVYNQAGDGALTPREIAKMLDKPYVPLPASAREGDPVGAQGPGRDRERAGAGRLPALPPGALEPAPQRGVRLRSAAHQPRSVRTLRPGARSSWLGVTSADGWSSSPEAPAASDARSRECFGAVGAKVALVDLPSSPLSSAREELESAGIEALAVPCDITDTVQVETAMEAVRGAFGRIDVLINNAGIVHRSAFAETRPEVFRRVMEVNLFGALHCTQACMDDIIAARGLIIAVSSIAGLAPLYGRSGYAASKHAMHGLFESLGAEVADRGVGVLMVCPSFVESGLEASTLGGDGKRVTRPRSKVGRAG